VPTLPPLPASPPSNTSGPIDQDPTTQELMNRGGLLNRKMTWLLGRSWRTTLLGIITTVCGVAVVIPGLPAPLVDVCKAVLPITSGSGLMLAKDFRVSGPPPPKR
jgi:hypothetical protein